MLWRDRAGAPATLAFAAILVFQLFVPPGIGVANNGDYGKLIGRFSLGPMDPKNPDERDYYEQRWRYDPAYHWVSDNYSSASVPLSVALGIGRLFSSHVFDMRILGAIHAALWIGCFVAALPLFPGWRRWLAVFVFSDVSYIAYFNSFHTDTVAFLSLAWTIVIAVRMAGGDWTGWIPFSALLTASLMFITAKPQHSLVGIPLMIVLAVCAPGTAGVLLAGLIPIAAAITLQHVPEAERKVEMFNAIFAKLLKQSTTPAADLSELGMPRDLQRWIGHYADEPDQPTLQPEVRDALTPAAHRRLALFAIRHPARAFELIYRDLGRPAANRRPPFLGNYERSTGLPPHTLAGSFYWWSAFRSFWFRAAPWHVLVWYALFAGAACFIRNKMAIIALVLAMQGILELGFAALGDIGETDRHLWLFHVITDITIVFAICGNRRLARILHGSPFRKPAIAVKI